MFSVVVEIIDIYDVYLTINPPIKVTSINNNLHDHNMCSYPDVNEDMSEKKIQKEVIGLLHRIDLSFCSCCPKNNYR